MKTKLLKKKRMTPRVTNEAIWSFLIGWIKNSIPKITMIPLKMINPFFLGTFVIVKPEWERNTQQNKGSQLYYSGSNHVGTVIVSNIIQSVIGAKIVNIGTCLR